MLASKIVCPHCHKALKATQPLALGKKVLCKQCGTTFRVSPTDVSADTPFPAKNATALPTAVAAPVVAVAGPPIASVEDEPITTEFDGSRLVKIGLVAVVLAGGFLLIAGGSALALVYALTRDRTPPANAKNDNTPDKPGRHEEEEDPSHQGPGNGRPLRPGQDDVKPETPPPPRLPPDEQEKVDKAIEKGLAYVKKMPTNLANHPHGVGLLALQGLTLLECGVAADDDAQVKAIAGYIRDKMPTMFETYNISLALLFLDRLGDAADRQHIQSLALRLVAGQQNDGGWTYNCNQRLTPAEEEELLGILKETRPSNPLELFIDANGKVSPTYVVPRPGEKLPEFILPGKGTDGDPQAERVKDIAKVLEKASPKMKGLPGLQPPGKAPLTPGNSDNSNTQFAILAVWVASRHDIPMERTLALIVKRFRTTQDNQGRWGYQGVGGGTQAMTCAGLLGLGAGYGMTAGPADKAARQPAVQDKAVQNAFKALEKVIDKPNKNGPKQRFNQMGVNLYFLWSLERVGVMYNVTNIGDKDWYRWGAELIVAHQKPDGSWVDASYPGGNPGEAARIDSCFALLFLKRANLAKDLSKKLEYIIDVKDLGNK